MKYLISLFFIIAACNSQSRIGDFKSISSFANINNIVFTDSLLVGVSESGLIYFNITTNSSETISIDEGLSYVDLHHIHLDKKYNFWIGSDKGVQIWDSKKDILINKFDLDIENITGFVNYNNFIYAAAKINDVWGIIEFRYVENKIYFRDFYQRVDLQNILKISLLNDDIYILSSDGVIAGNPFQEHISKWKNPFSGINEPIIDIEGENDDFYVLTTSSVKKFTRDSIVTIIEDVSELSSLKGLIVSENKIYAYSSTSIFHILDGQMIEVYSDQNLYINAVVRGNDHFWIATNFGLSKYSYGTYENFAHNQPFLNNPQIIEFYNNKIVIANRDGIAIEGWENYTTLSIPKIISNKFKLSTLTFDLGNEISKSLMQENLLFLSFINSQTAGIVSLDISNYQLPIISKYFPFNSQDSLQVRYSFDDMIFDRQNNLWATSSNNAMFPLSVFSNNQSRHFPANSPQNNLIDGNKSIVVDNYNRIWMSSQSGLLVYNYSGDIINPQDEEWVGIPVIEGVNRRALNYAVSGDNTLWIITNYGLIYKKLRAQSDNPVAETGPISNSGSITPYFQNIPFDHESEIYFDSNENLWITSNSRGLFVLDSNREYWPSSSGINSSNSNLLSNKINDIKFNSKDGLAYIATDLGVSKLKIPFRSEIKKTSKIDIFPSPYRIPSNRPMVIDGIPQKSSVQIMLLNGNIVKTLSQDEINEYQATWNGKNDEDVYVSSGVYLVLIINKKHNTSTIKKIAVIKN